MQNPNISTKRCNSAEDTTELVVAYFSSQGDNHLASSEVSPSEKGLMNQLSIDIISRLQGS